MQNITAVNYETSEGKAKQLLDGVNAKLGFVPKMMATMATSPAVLEGYLNFSGALGSSLNAKLREQIALTVAEINGCRYCASAHSAIGKMVGLDDHAVEESRRAFSHNAKTDAALKFVKALVISRGKVSEDDFRAAAAAGYSGKEIAEIVANVALNIFTNYFNETAKTVVDFPAIEFPLASQSAHA